MSAPQAPTETAGNALRALQGQSLEVNSPFEQVGRLAEAIKNGGGGGGGGTPADYNQVKQQVQRNKQDIAELNRTQGVQDTQISKNAQTIAFLAEILGVDLSVEYQPLAENEYVVLSGVKSIDTGLKMDGNAEIKATGYVATAGRQGVLVGAYKDNNSRTVFKFLSSGGKAQSCWAGLAEITAENMNGIDLNQPFSFVQNKDTATITQGENTVTVSNTGYSGSETDTAIFLFNQTENGEFNSAAIKSVEILSNGENYKFVPMKKIEIENNTQSVVILKNGRELPLNGGVLEIVEFQAA